MGTLQRPQPNCDPSIVASEINKSGFFVLPGYVGPDELAQAQSLVIATLNEKSGASVIVRGSGTLTETFISELPRDLGFLKFCRDIYEAGLGTKAPDAGCYQVLRCLAGTSSENAMRFHFDSYVLAALIPIIVPPDNPRGDLLLLPNVR